MKKLLIITIIFFSREFFAQNLIQTNIQNNKVKTLVEYEKKIGSNLHKSEENYVSFRPVEQPIIFERKEKDIPNLLVYYTFYKKDSTVAEILYEWDTYNFNKSENDKKPISFDKEMIKKYEAIVSEISRRYGKSKQEGDLKNLNQLNTETGLKRSDDWQINDSLKINSYIVLSEFYKKEGAITTNPTHMIRVYVTNERQEKGEELPKFDSTKITIFNEYFYQFVKNLKSSNFSSAREYLSEKIKLSATDEILKNLSASFKNDDLRDFMQGYQMMLDGTNYPMIQYRYANDSSDPPKETFTVIFEDSGKILGVKPMTLLKN